MNPCSDSPLHISILQERGGNKYLFYVDCATLCRNNKSRCLDFYSSFRVESGNVCFRLRASSLIFLFPSATCLKFLIGLFSKVSLYSERELVKVEQLWRLGCGDTAGIELRKTRPFGPHPPKYFSLLPSFANY